MTENDGTSSDPDAVSHPTAPLPTWALRSLSAIAGAVGVGGLFYSCGFLAIRSHLSFWGLWDGPVEDGAALASEGGRFLYHLAIVMVDLLNPLNGVASLTFYVLCIAGLTLWAAPTAPLRKRLVKRTRVARSLRIAFSLVPALVTCAWGLALLNDIRLILEPVDLLSADCMTQFERANNLVAKSVEIYHERILEWIVLAVLLSVNLWVLRLIPNRVARIAAWLGAVLWLAATSLLPVAYGRLALQPDYREIVLERDDGKPHPTDRVLIRFANSRWIAWNLRTRKIEVIAPAKRETLSIGPMRRLTIPDQSCFCGVCYVTH